ncbi:MAG: UDP-N-acetylglucosamine 2-epimerase [Haliscomenobacter sp.]|nr:UDP-N-acetylglucosamine 2-epimerase [Haliscomenobacter sp.]
MRKIAVVTGTRAEYGLLYWIIKGIEEDHSLELQLIVTGMHLSPEFGLTINQIIEDGFPIASKVEMLLSSDTNVGITKSMGLGLISFAEVFDNLAPDIVVVLGDRFEIFSAVSAAMIACIPVAHCHGGEATEGLIDEAIRHSITKMSHLHFTSTEEYKRRVIQLGEQPENVFNVGALGIESINKLPLMSKEETERSINFNLDSETALITFHPVTLEDNTTNNQFDALLRALKSNPDLKLVFTMPNADTDGRIIIEKINEYVQENPDNAVSFYSLGQHRYLSLLKYVTFVIGNSSSGLVEVPSFKIPTINIGDRQRGRIQARSVIQCEPTESSISDAISLARDATFKRLCVEVSNPYNKGNSSEKILPILRIHSLENIVKKRFYNLK